MKILTEQIHDKILHWRKTCVIEFRIGMNNNYIEYVSTFWKIFSCFLSFYSQFSTVSNM